MKNGLAERAGGGGHSIVRCAVYTRKSSEEGLDMAFNSLDAQREAGADFIKSQRHQGWTLVPHQYDDGGYSGGSTERPGLQRLLDDIQRGRVDVVVVYKVDRLSRSLSDFARLMQTFDEHQVSFVSVTQQFNTTTSMGRLTLNMLLSFAQFEREVTGERIRDKIAATKRKGVWVGGQPPLGYRLPRPTDEGYVSGDRVLRIVEPEAKLVRAVYTGYLETGSLVEVAAKLNHGGHSTKRWMSSHGNRHGGRSLSAAFLHRVLTNPIYIGKITHQRAPARSGGKPELDVWPGLHQPIIDQKTWDQVRGRMVSAERAVAACTSWTHTHLLKGKIRTFEDCAMSPGSVVRRPTKASGTGPGRDKRRVFYYISQKAIKHGFKACPIKTVSASFMDDLVRGLVLDHLSSSGKVDLRGAQRPVRDHWVRELVSVVVVALDRVYVDIAHERVAACMAANKSAASKRPQGSTGNSGAEPVPTCLLKPEVEEHGEYFRLVLPIHIKHDRAKRLIVGPNGRDLFTMATASGPVARAQLVEAIGLATAWHRELVRTGKSVESVAEAYGVADPRVHKLLPLAGLSPTILRDVLSGTIGRTVTLTDLLRAARSLDWNAQMRYLRS